MPGGAIVRVETDADGNAAYEAHMTERGRDARDGVRRTRSFDVVMSVESR